MPGTGGRDYYVISVKGERGPVDRNELRELLVAAEIRNDDQVRNAFGRNLGTVAQVLATPSDRQGVASDRNPAPAHRTRVQPPARPATVPVAIIIVALLIATAAAIWLFSQREAPVPPPPPPPPTLEPQPEPAPKPVPPPIAPVVKPVQPALLLPAIHRPIAIAPGQVSANGPKHPRYLHVPAINAADASLATKWCDPVGKRDAAGRLSWISYATGARRIVAYALASADNEHVRDPRSWWLVGVRADGREQVLDSRSNETFSEFFQRRIFPIAEPGDYIAYRLDILEVKSLPPADGVQISEFSLYESPPPAMGANGLPTGWAMASIGNDGSPPSCFSAGMWTVAGAGRDIWTTADQFRLAYTTVPEEATITAFLISSDARYPWAKAGIMLRVSSDPGSAFAALVIGFKNGIQFIHRPTPSATALGTAGDSASLPMWVRLVRRGSAVTARVSNNGNQWRDAGSVNLPVFTGPLLAGLAVCSKVPGKPAKAVFDGVEITSP